MRTEKNPCWYKCGLHCGDKGRRWSVMLCKVLNKWTVVDAIGGYAAVGMYMNAEALCNFIVALIQKHIHTCWNRQV